MPRPDSINDKPSISSSDAHPVIYGDWRGEEWTEAGRYCRHLPTRCLFHVRGGGGDDLIADLIEGEASAELPELAKGYYRVFGCQNRYPGELNLFETLHELDSASFAPGVTPEQIDELEQWLQTEMPQGWKIVCLREERAENRQNLTGYELQLGFDTFAIDARGHSEAPPGWMVRHINRAFYDEFIVTAPDGTEALISDILLA